MRLQRGGWDAEVSELARARSQEALSAQGTEGKCWLSLEEPGAPEGGPLEEQELNASQEGAGEEKPKPLFLRSHLLLVPPIAEPGVTGAWQWCAGDSCYPLVRANC